MTECAPFRALLLEVEPETLDAASAGVPDRSGLAAHLGSCASCRSAARRIREGNRALDATLKAAPGVDAAALLARARLRPAGEERTPRRRRAPAAWVGLAAAAALAALLVLPGEPDPIPATTTTPPEREYALVEAGPEDNVAVMPTDDPDITVLWFYPRGG